MTDVIDLGSGRSPGELEIVLECRGCEAVGSPVRRRDDPSTIVRCATCGKRHSVESLEAR